MGLLDSFLPKAGGNQSEDYKRGYEACEKKNKKLEQERDTAVYQLKKLGYEVGEDLDPIREASNLKKQCRMRTSCEGCSFNASGVCVLKGDNPSEWMVL